MRVAVFAAGDAAAEARAAGADIVGAEDLAAQRAENAKAYLTRSKGIDASRIQTRPAQSKTGAKVVVVLAPAGAPQ